MSVINNISVNGEFLSITDTNGYINNIPIKDYTMQSEINELKNKFFQQELELEKMKNKFKLMEMVMSEKINSNTLKSLMNQIDNSENTEILNDILTQ